MLAARTTRIVWLMAKVVVSGGLLWFVLSQAHVPTLVEHVRTLDVAWLAPIMAAYATTVVISGWRWLVLLRAQDVETGAWPLFESLLVAQFFNNFLPSNIGGDVMRIADTAPAARSRTLATTVILVDRALGLFALVVVAAFGSFVAGRRGAPVPGAGYLWTTVGLATLTGAVLLGAPHLFPRLLAPLRRLEHEWIDTRIGRLEQAFDRFMQAKASLVYAFAGAVAVQAAAVAYVSLLAHAMHIPLPILTAAVLVPVSFVIQMLPITLNGFGVREGVYIYFFAHAGLDLEPAVALSLVQAGLMVLLSAVGGVLFALRGRSAKEVEGVEELEAVPD